MQRALRLIYPPQCLSCGERVVEEGGLCAACWSGAGFIGGLVCDKCGVPLVGADDGEAAYCDDCLTIARPWRRGRAVMTYGNTARRIALQLKYGDRLDIARPAGLWMARAAQSILVPGMVVAPVPLHWLRLFRRRYNQAALLADRVARELGLGYCPDLLIRARRTESQEGRDREARFANMAAAIRAHPGRRRRLAGRHVLLVDDVFTSGATLAAAAEACLAGGAEAVSILVLARVAKAP